ncbi:MAG: hypothetical protein Salg2KO_09170 [Salibacteraceae bacterium]
MKTINALLIGLLLIIGGNIHAQQSVEIGTDSLYVSFNPCPTPSNANIFIVGEAENYNSATDSVEIIIYWGDGSSDTLMRQLIETGVTDYWNSGNNNHIYNLPGNYTITITATMPNNIADTASPTNQVSLSSTCLLVDGYTYKDLNNNCTLDATDDTLSSRYVLVTDANGGFISSAYSNLNGYYALAVPSGQTNLNIEASSWYGLSTVCPTAGSYTFNSNSSQSFNFGLECVNNSIDSRVYSNSFTALAGTNGWARARAYIWGCGNIPAVDTITLTIDTSVVNYVAPAAGTPTPDLINGGEISWYFSYVQSTNGSYNWGQSPLFKIITQTDTSVQLGDSSCFSVNLTHRSNDSIPANNSINYCREINVSYDPNNKINLPSGLGPLGLTDTSTSMISYRVNFQNTGTAPAQNIYIIDTISDHFDMASFRLLNTSHDDVFSFKYLDNNIVRFDFTQIYLPDSASDPEGSQGYIDFEIDLKPNLPIGTTIENTAYIYFDWNAPIVTNTAINTLYAAPIIEEPAEDIVISFLKGDVTCLENDNGNVSTTVTGGVTPYSYAWSNGDAASNLEALAPGTYTLSVTDDAGTIESSSVIIEENRQFEAPVIGEVTGELEVIAWTEYTYSVPATNGSNFEWIVEGGDLISSTANTAEIMWRAGPDGSLSILETDVNGCTLLETIEVPIEFLGVNEIDNDGLMVYPNPTTGLFYLRIAELTGSEHLTVSDIQGRVVYTAPIRSTETVVSDHELRPGVYNINLSNDSMTINKKLIIR